MPVTTDDLFHELGNPGKSEVFIFVLLIYCYIFVAWNNVIMAVYGSYVPFLCRTTDVGEIHVTIDSSQRDGTCAVLNVTSLNKTANHSGSCTTGWIYNTTEVTMVTEWDLVCDKEYLVAVASSALFAGSMVGGFFFGFLSDHVGRKPIILLTLYGQLVIGVGLFFVPYYALMAVLRFVLGVLIQGLHTAVSTMSMELFRPSFRSVAGACTSVAWGFSYVGLSGIWYLIQDWRYIQLAITLPSALTIFYIWLLPESLRWLLSKKKFEPAEKVVQRTARWNGVPFPKNTFTQIASQQTTDDVLKTTRYTVLDLFRTPVIRRRSLALFFIGFSANVVYFGLSLEATHLPGNKFINFFISGVVEIPIYIINAFVLKRFGRRIPMALYFILSGVTCIASGFVNSDEDSVRQTISVSLAMCGKFGAAGIFTVVFICFAEMYPTVIRNIGSGACVAFLNVGGIAAPQILLLSTVSFQQLPIVIFGGFALVAGGLTLTLPETVNTVLPDKIEEVENLPPASKTSDKTEQNEMASL